MPEDPSRASRRRAGLVRPQTLVLVSIILVGGGFLLFDAARDDGRSDAASAPAATDPSTSGTDPADAVPTQESDATAVGADDSVPTPATEDSVPETTSTTRPPYDGWVDPLSSGEPWGSTVEGLLTFRGNPTRSWYGTGPLPAQPAIQWDFEIGCSQSWWLRPGRPLPRRRDGRAHHPGLPDGRHHQGLGHDRPGRLPARLHGFP
jgi:hypothetical protein